MTTADPERVGLLACSRSKLDRPAPARELYVSPLFRAARAFAERDYGPGNWFVLSARCDLVDPDQILAPYDFSLRHLSAREREAWTNRVALLTNRFPAETVLWYHAGELYRDGIARLVPHEVCFPLAGLRIGEQLRWYRLHTLSLASGA